MKENNRSMTPNGQACGSIIFDCALSILKLIWKYLMIKSALICIFYEKFLFNIEIFA
jgi:hypothetical protein